MTLLKINIDNKPQIADLNSKLLKEVKKASDLVSVSYLVDDTNIFESLNEYGLELIYNKAYEIQSYDIQSISSILKSINCTDISTVKIRPKGKANQEISILKILDFQVKYRNKHFCLYQGRWANFNISYLNFIEDQIKKANEIANYNYMFDLTDHCLDQGRKMQTANIAKYDQVTYAEYPFNIFLENEFNYKLLDRKIGQKDYTSIEFADLYDPVNHQSLIHVKIGKTPSLRYCIQQSLHSAEIFATQDDVLSIHGITNVKKIAMLLVLDSHNIISPNNEIDFSKNASFYFKIEIVEWASRIRGLGYIPEIIISKDLRTK
ncbi:DUF6119 family protein [Paenibacillus sp. WLX1005]|uniref:DUF6119 family protein n=1 Tax=Paenibacillus sp. WLX1005 TaxID=3243766 RepID=UPI0039845C02